MGRPGKKQAGGLGRSIVKDRKRDVRGARGGDSWVCLSIMVVSISIAGFLTLRKQFNSISTIRNSSNISFGEYLVQFSGLNFAV